MREITKCPFCGKKFVDQDRVELHVGRHHGEQTGGVSPAQYLFSVRNGKDRGQCIMYKKVTGCLKWTEFNEKSKKFNRLCKNPECKEQYVESFRERMMAKHGKHHLLDDPDVQRKMLENRSISGRYVWGDGREFVYTGEYERDFLEYCDRFLEWPGEDIVAPAPFEVIYVLDGKKHVYIPDAYLMSLDLVVEIKGTSMYQKRDREKEEAKDRVMARSEHSYIKIVDKKYDDFLKGLVDGRWRKGR